MLQYDANFTGRTTVSITFLCEISWVARKVVFSAFISLGDQNTFSGAHTCLSTAVSNMFGTLNCIKIAVSIVTSLAKKEEWRDEEGAVMVKMMAEEMKRCTRLC